MLTSTRTLVFVFALAAAVAFGGTRANAEPGPVGQWLMNEPASLWTIGMMRLELYIEGWTGLHPLVNYYRGAEYRWDENRINIYAYSFEQKYSKEKCAELISELRDSGLVRDGRVIGDLENSTYADYFGQIGYQSKTIPKDYHKRLDEIIKVEVRLAGGACEGKLVSKEILYRDQ